MLTYENYRVLVGNLTHFSHTHFLQSATITSSNNVTYETNASQSYKILTMLTGDMQEADGSRSFGRRRSASMCPSEIPKPAPREERSSQASSCIRRTSSSASCRSLSRRSSSSFARRSCLSFWSFRRAAVKNGHEKYINPWRKLLYFKHYTFW